MPGETGSSIVATLSCEKSASVDSSLPSLGKYPRPRLAGTLRHIIRKLAVVIVRHNRTMVISNRPVAVPFSACKILFRTARNR